MTKTLPLTCPCVQKVKLRLNNGIFTCLNNRCVHSNPLNGFETIDQTPILISELLTDTVCSASRSETYVARHSHRFKRLKNFLSYTSETTKRNCLDFIRILQGLNASPRVLVIGGAERGSGTENPLVP